MSIKNHTEVQYNNRYQDIDVESNEDSIIDFDNLFDNFDESTIRSVKEYLDSKCSEYYFQPYPNDLSVFSLFFICTHFPDENEDYIDLISDLQKFDKLSSNYPKTIELYKDLIGIKDLISKIIYMHEVDEIALSIIETNLLNELKNYIEQKNDPVVVLTLEGTTEFLEYLIIHQQNNNPGKHAHYIEEVSRFLEYLIIHQQNNTPEKLSHYMQLWRALHRQEDEKTDIIARQMLFYMACSSVYAEDDDFKKINNYNNNYFDSEGIEFLELFKFINPLILKIITERNPKYSPLDLAKIEKLHKIASLALSNTTNYTEIFGCPKLNVATFNILNELISSEDNNDFDILIPGGWVEHAVMYLIHKESATNKYTFSVFNTGEGINHHNWKDGKFQTEASWGNRNLKDLANSEFIQKLFEFYSQDYDLENNPYTYFNQYFSQQDSPSKNPLEFHYEQMRGNCTWKSAFRAIAKLLGEAEDPSLTLKVKEDLIQLACEEFKKIIPAENQIEIDPLLLSFGKKAQGRLKQKQAGIDATRQLYESLPEYRKDSLSFPEFLGYQKKAKDDALKILWRTIRGQFTGKKPKITKMRDVRKWMSHPKNVGRLDRITNLNLAYTKISVIPLEIIYLNNLKSLDLTGNSISVIPHEIEKLQNLETVVIRKTLISSIPLNLRRRISFQMGPTF